MKKLLLIALLLPVGVVSCKETKLEKPFVIVDKQYFSRGKCDYEFQDKNGIVRIFSDFENKYSIGDTIK